MTVVIPLSTTVLTRSAPRSRDTTQVLTAAVAAIVGLCLVYGLWSAVVASTRRNHVGVVADTTAVALSDGQFLRTTLSDADATASALFLTGPDPSPELRQRYDLALAEAATAVTAISRAEADDTEVADITERIAARLPYYAGLVDTALANHRQGYPLGQAYLSQANTFMRDQLLTDVDELVALEQDRLDDRLGDAASVLPTVGPLLVLAAALAAIVGLQWWLASAFRRTVNLPLALATLLLAGALVTQLTVLVTLRGEISATRSEGSEPLARLTEIRALALEARSADSLRLVTADTVTAYVASSEESQEALAELLDDPDNGPLLDDLPGGASYLRLLQDDREDFAASHGALTASLDENLNLAVADATGDGANQLTAIGDRFDDDLDAGIGWATDDLLAHIDRMTGLLAGLRVATLLLGLSAAACALAGVRQRLAEYR
jgi:hypothetical protein